MRRNRRKYLTKLELHDNITQQPTNRRTREIYQILRRIYEDSENAKKLDPRSRNKAKIIPSSLKLVFATPSVNITNLPSFTPLQAVWQWWTILHAAQALPCTIWWHFQLLTLEGRVQQSVLPTHPRGCRLINSWTHNGLTWSDRLQGTSSPW